MSSCRGVTLKLERNSTTSSAAGLVHRTLTEQHLRDAIKLAPDFPVSYIYLAVVLAAAGDGEGARKAGAEILKRMPEATASTLNQQFPHAKPEHLARMVDGLRSAGLPE